MKPLRILVLCTGNAGRSQMAEALLNRLGDGKIVAESAGTRPSPRVNPLAISTLAENGIDWAGHPPRGIDGLDKIQWDFVITVCDNAHESCPVFPGRTTMLHWSTPDPRDAATFGEAFRLLKGRVEQFVAGLA